MMNWSRFPLALVSTACGMMVCALLGPGAQGAELFRKSFTSGEGHGEAAGIGGTDGWTAQGDWIAMDVTGEGQARCAGNWQRAKVNHDLSPDLEVDESIRLEAVWRGEGMPSAPGNVSVFRIGVADSILHTGQNIPAVSCEVRTATDDTLRFGTATDYLSMPLADAFTTPATATHWFRLSMSITRSVTADTFGVVVEVTDLDANQPLGSVEYAVVDAASYAAPGLHAAMRTLDLTGSGFTASQVDEFSAVTLEAGSPVDVTLDLTRQLFIGGVSTLSRKQFINWHEEAKSSSYSAAEANRLFVDLGVNVGRSVGGLSWVRSQMPTEDPARPGHVDVAALTSYCQANADGYSGYWPRRLFPGGEREDHVWTDHTDTFPHVRQPGETDFVAGSNAAAAEWISTVFQNYWSPGNRPAWFEPVNEPFVHMNEFEVPGTGELLDEQGVVDFHAAVIDRLHLDVPEVMVGGPCSAWPEFALWGYDHWNQRMKNFIDDVGDRADFISWHIYSTMDDSGVLTPDRMGSNVDYMIDLVENYSNNVHGTPMPMLFSEYGGGFKNTSSWVDAYTPQRDWLVLRSCLGKTLQFMTRPDRIVKIIPFITGKTGSWYSGTSSYPWVLFRRPDGVNGSAPYQETHLIKFYEFFQGLAGNQFPVVSGDPDVLALAFVDGARVQLLVGSLDDLRAHTVNIAAQLDPSVTVTAATVGRLYWDGVTPVWSVEDATGSWQELTLRPEEYIRLELTLSEEPQRLDQLHRRVHYGDRTVVEYTGSAEVFTVAADLDPDRVQSAVLRVGVSRPHGEYPVPAVTFNGQPLNAPADWAGAGQSTRNEFSGALVFPVPSSLVGTSNAVVVSFASDAADDFISSVVLETSETRSVSEIVTRLVEVPGGGGGYHLEFDSLPGVSYQLQKSTDLSGWLPSGEPVAGDGALHSFPITSGEPREFFRVAATVQ